MSKQPTDGSAGLPNSNEQQELDELEQARAECPFCVMMRKGGCEDPFQAFMECGSRADKGDHDMVDCLPYFNALQGCMDKNKEVFDSILEEMKAADVLLSGAASASPDNAAAAAGGAGEEAAPSSSSGQQQAEQPAAAATGAEATNTQASAAVISSTDASSRSSSSSGGGGTQERGGHGSLLGHQEPATA